jgi:hypothetical protein
MSAFMSQIAAERRWIVSGTPTTGVSTEVGLAQLHRLLGFLRHPLVTQFEVEGGGGSGGKKVKLADTSQIVVTASDAAVLEFNFPSVNPKPRSSDDFWKRCVVKPCLAQSEQAWGAVTELLKSITVRHRKVCHHYNSVHANANFLHIRSTLQVCSLQRMVWWSLWMSS